MKAMKMLLTSVCILRVLTVGPDAMSMSFELIKIADQNTAMPEGDGIFDMFYYLDDIDGSNVVFGARAQSWVNEGIYLFSGNSLSKVADRKTRVPGGTDNFSWFWHWKISGSNVAFCGLDESNKQGIYLFNGGTLSKVADTNTPVPGGTGNFTKFADIQFHHGQKYVLQEEIKLSGSSVVFWGCWEGGEGIYLFDGNTIIKVADSQTLIPEGSGYFGYFGKYYFDGLNLVFSGTGGIYHFNGITLRRLLGGIIPFPEIEGTSCGFTDFQVSGSNVLLSTSCENSVEGLYLFDGATWRKVVDTNTLVPGGSGCFHDLSYPPRMSGTIVVFKAWNPEGHQGIYLFDGTSLSKIADENTRIPNLEEFRSGLYISGTNVVFDAGGLINRSTYFFNGSTLTRVTYENTIVPGGIEYFTYSSVQGFSGSNITLLIDGGKYLATANFSEIIPVTSLATGNFDGTSHDALGAVDAQGKIHYTKNLQDWQDVPGVLVQIAGGSFYGGGTDGLAGVTESGQIFYTVDLLNWNYMPGQLAQLTCCDLNGDGRDDLAGVTDAGQIFYSLDLTNWDYMPGQLAQLTCCDLNGDGRDDLVGVTDAGQIFYSLDLTNWNQMWGQLAQLSCGDLNGDGRGDLAGITSAGQIFYSVDLANWNYMPGKLSQLSVGDLNGDGRGDLVGFISDAAIYYSVDLVNWQWVSGNF